MSRPYRVSMICSGNICRSPMGEIILRRLLDEAGLGAAVEVDSAGTGDWHVGGPADPRTLTALTAGGYDGSAHIAQHADTDFLARHDLLLAADEGHLRRLRRLADTARLQVGPDGDVDIRLLREFDPAAVAAGTLEVDDPYYGDAADFERCRDEVEAACRGLVEHLREQLG